MMYLQNSVVKADIYAVNVVLCNFRVVFERCGFNIINAEGCQYGRRACKSAVKVKISPLCYRNREDFALHKADILERWSCKCL